ncbi:lipopolysaccharide transport system permease protein [Duganella sp. OV458]|jgi:lipopolysaccharide transport system permease protein|nr:lipopolysaccharide transport system permease protein [Duganella sp. OV458]SDJ11543.1 lipopolysaccharide transport system permease protein [Duganella sp. OV510]
MRYNPSLTFADHYDFSCTLPPAARPAERRMSAMLRALWHHRSFVFGSVQREFQSKYRNTMLGAAWTVLNPLAMILVYTLIFSQVMQSRLPGDASRYGYSIYLCAGVLSWGLFAEITSRGQNMFLEQANLLKKISFPRICLPVIVVLNALVNFGIIFSLFTVFLMVTGQFPGAVFLLVLPLLLLQVALAIGLGLILGVLNVFFRDIGQFFQIFIQFWFWFTPIVYPASILPAELRPWLAWNPMAAVIQGYHNILLTGSAPAWDTLLPAAVLAVLLCALGMRLFRKRAGEMVDEL